MIDVSFTKYCIGVEGSSVTCWKVWLFCFRFCNFETNLRKSTRYYRNARFYILVFLLYYWIREISAYYNKLYIIIWIYNIFPTRLVNMGRNWSAECHTCIMFSISRVFHETKIARCRVSINATINA